MSFYYLDIIPNLDKEALNVVIPVTGGLLGFIVFWFTQQSVSLKQKFISRYGNDKGIARFIMWTRYLGGFTIGVLPALAYFIAFPETSLTELGLAIQGETMVSSLLWTAGLCLLIIPLFIVNARKAKNLAIYPQIRASKWDSFMMVGNLFSWAIYLLGYEFFFRGLLLFPLVDTIGLWPAIAINIALYSGTHIPKGLNETIGAIPLSVVLCLLCVTHHTVWIAFFVHVAMAWTNTLTAFSYHTEMKFVK